MSRRSMKRPRGRQKSTSKPWKGNEVSLLLFDHPPAEAVKKPPGELFEGAKVGGVIVRGGEPAVFPVIPKVAVGFVEVFDAVAGHPEEEKLK